VWGLSGQLLTDPTLLYPSSLKCAQPIHGLGHVDDPRSNCTTDQTDPTLPPYSN